MTCVSQSIARPWQRRLVGHSVASVGTYGSQLRFGSTRGEAMASRHGQQCEGHERYTSAFLWQYLPIACIKIPIVSAYNGL